MQDERKKIFDAAVEEFTEHGIKATSMKAISERAGLDEGAARALFVDKERLFRELLKEYSEPLVSASGFVAQDIDDPRQFLRKSLKLYDRWLLENPRLVQLIAWGIAEGVQFFGSIYSHVLYPSEFLEKLQKFIWDGQIRIKDIYTVFILIESMMVFSHLMKSNIKSLYP
ncbi:MAG TPA: TetR/AcrR family transcriptional regulator, partial [candidate division Zixibacteria bacterium]|nr:TetR/AcrR family transcriptional regulator [candidate division Zixibacteria bacterium]